MPRERNADTGRYTETYPVEVFAEALEAEDGMASTREIADHVECSLALAYKRLRTLEDDGRVTSRKIANGRLWIAPEEDDS